MKRAVIFDWDGTLYDSSGLLDQAIDVACGMLPAHLAEQASAPPHTTEDGSAARLQSLLARLPSSERAGFQRRVANEFMLRERRAGLLPGVRPLLDRLHGEGLLLCIATGRQRSRLASDLRKLTLQHLFAFCVCGDEAPAKPDAEMLERVMRVLSLSPEQCVFVGDHVHDQQAATAAGIAFIGARWDGHDHAGRQFDEATLCTAATDSLMALLLEWSRGVPLREPTCGSASRTPPLKAATATDRQDGNDHIDSPRADRL